MKIATPPEFKHTSLTAYPNTIAGVSLLDESPTVTGVYLRNPQGGLWPARTVNKDSKHYDDVCRAWLRRAGAEDRRGLANP